MTAEALAEELRHSGAGKMLRHNAGTASEDGPSQQGAEEGVSDSGPCGGDTVAPAELPGVADEHDRREIRSPVGERGQPRPDGTSAEYEAVDIGGVAAAVEADSNHQPEEYHQHERFQNHKNPFLSNDARRQSLDCFCTINLYRDKVKSGF